MCHHKHSERERVMLHNCIARPLIAQPTLPGIYYSCFLRTFSVVSHSSCFILTSLLQETLPSQQANSNFSAPCTKISDSLTSIEDILRVPWRAKVIGSVYVTSLRDKLLPLFCLSLAGHGSYVRPASILRHSPCFGASKAKRELLM